MAGFLGTLFSGGAEREAADKNRKLYDTYQTQGTGFLDKAYTSGTGYLKDALGAYTPLSDLAGDYRKGSGLYMDALGVNGSDAAKAAQGSFTTSPGYQQGIDAGIDVLNRRRAAGGMLNSGNADIDALTFGQNQQNQQYNGWLDRLGGLNNNALSATGAVASGQAGVNGGLADLSSQYGQNQIGLLGNTTSGQAGANTLQAQGEASGARNLLGAGMSLASLAAGGFGGAGLGSALGGAAGSAVSGSFGPTSFGGANGPTPLTGGSMLGRLFS